MALFLPQFVVLDTATLVRMSRDYWSQDSGEREKVRSVLTHLKDRGVHITFTLTHVFELLRHEQEDIVRDRIRFLRQLPLIAWLRPYDRNWFPGDIPDLLRRELHAVIHDFAKGWASIIEAVRPDLWETGTGSEMFVENEEFWTVMQQEAKRQHSNEKYVASVARTDPGQIGNLKVSNALKMVKRPKTERHAYLKQLAHDIRRQLEQHGDERLETPSVVADQFVANTLKDAEAIELRGQDTLREILGYRDIPPDLIKPEMTISEVGELAVNVKQLKILVESLKPPADLSVKDIPPDTLPSYVIQRRLSAIQRKAPRVSGSDLGDGHMAPLVLYADGVDVDKRTFEYLRQIKKAEARFETLMHKFFKSPDYSTIPENF